MNLQDLQKLETVEERAAQAFAASRDCVTALNVDIIPNLHPRERTGPKRLISAIENRRIFEQDTLTELDVLIEKVSRRILHGSEQIEQFVADECHTDGGGTVTHHHQTFEAEALARALPFLIELKEALLDVQDLMHAIRAVDKLRQRI